MFLTSMVGNANLDDVLIVNPEVILVTDLLVLIVDGDDDLISRHQLHLGVDARLHDSRPDLRSLRVERDADRQTEISRRLANVVDRL